MVCGVSSGTWTPPRSVTHAPPPPPPPPPPDADAPPALPPPIAPPPPTAPPAIAPCCASRASRPYSTPPTLAHTNPITFCVSVPVLSDMTYCTCPSSSFKAVVRQAAGVSVSAWYIALSWLISSAHWNTLTTSSVT